MGTWSRNGAPWGEPKSDPDACTGECTRSDCCVRGKCTTSPAYASTGGYNLKDCRCPTDYKAKYTDDGTFDGCREKAPQQKLSRAEHSALGRGGRGPRLLRVSDG